MKLMAVTAPPTLGNLQLTVTATGPITTPASVPLRFPSSGKLTELDVSVGQVTIGHVHTSTLGETNS